MKIAVIGAGFAGLAAAYELSKKGHSVSVFEKETVPGGLAIGFSAPGWSWRLEKHYHHFFVSDWAIRKLAEEVGHKIDFVRPKTSVYIGGDIYQLDSPLNLLGFPKISLMDRIRTGLALFYLKVTPYWKYLEGTTARDFIKTRMGEASWRVLWQPLFEKKFGRFAESVPASWFWTRINKRSASFGYPRGGYQALAETLQTATQKAGGKFVFGAQVSQISKKAENFSLKVDGKTDIFDGVICTLPTPLFLKITKGLPEWYVEKLGPLHGLGAVNLIVCLKEHFLPGREYWLNINEPNFPFLGVIEHTNMINPKYYANERIIYVGNYLEPTHKYFSYTPDRLLEEFMPFLIRINPKFSRSWVIRTFISKAAFAQPVIPLNYSRILPTMQTPIEGLFLANIQQVYPWDRGTNYAVELGKKAASYVQKTSFEKLH
ncbi:hypothetical protein A2115_03020 [Candidatus Woesebacteria bacterium GWA1_41_8]|uniref:Amine oxidase domain-containing protein n=1 Tax=Candidatus Woesebacteria bacterium GWA1_41_8 TaxID=1802471 RepID=A0A1F7WJ23_9BACT|nr:MAG: hypothetical protein A2115_03020 [Candidatus Woesebacteria bacterium GWA1_41_8]